MDEGISPGSASSASVQCPPTSSSSILEAQKQIERTRVNELLRFFEPPPEVDLATQSNKPRIATDPALTSFAQLAALRLNCERCFISLIDDSKQYIIAEATRTIGLKSEDIYDEDNDKLSFGQTILDFKTGVCPGTIACFTSLDSSKDLALTYVKASREYYVMNDMSKLEGYTHRPYVAEWPFMKYYAEVPIHSPTGHTIGTICVVDNKSRDGLDLKGLSVLKEISTTIMGHLELCASKIQRNRAERMIQALGQFVEGHDSVKDLWVKGEESRLPEPSLQHLSLDERTVKEFGSPRHSRKMSSDRSGSLRSLNLNDPARQSSATTSDRGSARLPYNRTTSVQSVKTVSSVRSTSESNLFSAPNTTPNTASNTVSSSGALNAATTTSLDEHARPIADDARNEETSVHSQDLDTLETVLYRAANLIREAIDLDGVVFQDQSSIQKDSPAKIIACSAKDDRNDSTHQHSVVLQPLSEKFPNGGLLSFDSAGLIRAIPFDTQLPQPSITDQTANFAFGELVEDEITAQVRASLNIDELRGVFPNVASLTVYPLWDTRRDKCVAYCFAWSANPARVFQRQDVIYMASFSNSIIAQLARMETFAADQAKTIFLSSISHELRSPLHGILASMEILRDLVSDDSHHDVINLVESCGSALLDTIDNVLEYSQTNRQIEQPSTIPKSQSPGRHDGRPVAAVDLGGLIEDVTSICLVGLQYSRSLKNVNSANETQSSGGQVDPQFLSNGPIVICELGLGRDLLFKTDSAIFTRIVTNILGNALKYTFGGFILVKFEYHRALVESNDASTNEGEVRLTVKDSGKGMSKDYLAHHLFKPFHQENALTPGTGLGLSIVSRLVDSIGGQINISSEVEVGTEVTITAKMKSTTSEFARKSTEISNLEAGLTLGFFDLNAVPNFDDLPAGILSSASEAVLLLRSTISQYASEENMQTTTAASIDSKEVDILVIEDFRFRNFPLAQFQALKKPVIVLSTKLLADNDSSSYKLDNVVVLPRPFGPRMFKRSLAQCQKIRDEIQTAADEPIIPEFVFPPVELSQLFLQRNEVAAEDLRKSTESNIADLKPPTTTVLLVEDNAINLKLLVACVKKMKYNILIATNGEEAVEVYSNFDGKIPLIFMDIQMPVMDGTEATRRIRQHERDHSMTPARIVALTALGTKEAKEIALSCGADLFLTKPVSLKTLTGLMVEYCEPPL